MFCKEGAGFAEYTVIHSRPDDECIYVR